MARKSRKNLQQPEQAATSVLLPELEEAKMPAAIYGRLSVEDEETEESMETQIALVQDYINRSRELSYVDTYFDNGFTGTNFKRPAFTRLMNDVRQKKIKCIVVKDLSRFGRNYLEAGYYIETVFPFLGIRLIAVTDNFDSARKEDMESLALPIRNMVNAMYAKDISLFGMDFLSAGQCAIGNGDSFVPHASVARNGSTSNADRRICDFYDTAGGRRRGSTSGTGGSNASAGMVHIRRPTRTACLWNCLNKSNALIVERICIFSAMRVFHSAGM